LRKLMNGMTLHTNAVSSRHCFVGLVLCILKKWYFRTLLWFQTRPQWMNSLNTLGVPFKCYFSLRGRRQMVRKTVSVQALPISWFSGISEGSVMTFCIAISLCR
jgi:hypothetical protein